MKFANPCTTTKDASPAADFTARIVDPDGNELASSPTKKSSLRAVETRQINASPFQCNSFSSDSYSSNRLIQDFKNFRQSSAPSRFLLFRDGSWADFPRQVFDALKAGFIAGKAVLDVAVDHIEEQRNIAPRPKLEIEIRINKGSSTAESDRNNSLKRKREVFEPIEGRSDESPEASSTASLDGPRWPGVEVLRDGNRYYKLVEKLFLSGMKRFAPETVITSIHKCSHSSPSGNSRLKAFQMRIEMTKANRGGGNVKFGWYGASARDVAAIVSHGFGQPDHRLLDSAAAYGVGILLSPPQSPYASSLSSEEDDDGERHIILCRAIMGKSEKVAAGSLQFHPSSEEFDSGVDDLANPKWYIIWSTHMNTHILPEYVVSFKSSKPSQEMGGSLPSPRKQAVKSFYNHYKAGKMSKDTFIKHLRSIVGDKLLASTIRRIRGY